MNGRAAAARLVALPAQAQEHVDRVRVGFLGVKPEYQHTGVAAGLVRRALRHGRGGHRARAARWAGSSRPTRAMNRGMEAMGGRIVKRYRVYERPL